MNQHKRFLIPLISSILCGLLLVATACQGTPLASGPELTLEEHALQSPPDPDTGTFLPVEDSQEDVLSQHQAERQLSAANLVEFSDQEGVPVMTSQGPGETLTAIQLTSETDSPRQIVKVRKGEEVIFNVDAGLPTPALQLQSLWSYDDSWTLEILYSEEDLYQGRIYQDGQLINDTHDYQDAFSFQLLAGKPFYFYQKEGQLGYVYNGQEVPLPYDQIPHYNCCSESSLNPRPAQNMVSFYAQTGSDWYYVELGNFNQ